MTTDPRKLAQEARKNEGNAYNDRGYSKSTDAILQKRREKIIELAAALDTALDEQDTLREKISSHESADYEWQKNAALFWREKDRISEAEISRLQDENERLRVACICESCHKPMAHICESDECVRAALAKQG